MSNGKMPDLGALMKQAQALQANMSKAQAELAKVTCEGTAGGGMVKANVNGDFDLVSIAIDPTCVDPADVGMLQDLVIAAVNQATAKVREESKKRMASIMGGMPGLPPGLL